MFHQKYFQKNIFTKNISPQKNIFKNIISQKTIFLKKITFTKNSSKNICFLKNISKKIHWPNIFLKKGGGEAPLLPAGPRLISSDSEISA